MSQASSQALDPNWVSLHIVKFSHNTSPYGTRTYTWNHISSRSDLEFSIRNTRYVDDEGHQYTRVIMKVSAGADVMETQDLLELVKFCQQFDPSTGAEHPVEVAIRSPFLAMRYPKTVNNVRRLQIKFHSHEDYHKVFSVLKDLGLPITNRETTTPNNPQPPPSPALSLSTSTSSTTLNRPSSALDVPVAYNGLGSSPLKSEFKVPPRPESTLSEGGVRNNDLPRITRPFSTSFSTPSIVPNPMLSRVNSFQSSQSQSPIFQSPNLGNESSHFFHPTSQHSEHKAEIHPKTSLYVDQLQQSGLDVAGSTGNSRTLSASPFFTPPAGLSATSDQPISNPFAAPEHSNLQRPASTPNESTLTPSSVPDYRFMLTSSLPPKRELPFLKPAEASKPRKSSLSDLPQLSKEAPVIRPPSKAEKAENADLATTTPKAAPKKRVAQSKAPTTKAADEVLKKSQLNSEDVVMAEPDAVTEEPSPLAAKSAALVVRPSSTPSGLVSKVIPPPKKRTTTPAIRPPSSNKRLKMVDQSTQTDISSVQPQAPQRNTPLTSSTSAAPPPNGYFEAIDDFVSKHKSRPPPTELWDIPGWADADNDHREKLLNHFICENLENSQFLKLCEDIETSWRRIGLGM